MPNRPGSIVGEAKWQLADLHKGLDSTLNIAHNEIKYRSHIIKDYGQLPLVECIPSQINQVFMNILVNAAQAIERDGTITVKTDATNDMIRIAITDNGKGIAPDHLTRIFEPFFTTKPIGKGTGLGLSLSYGIVQKHHGHIEAESDIGHGTTFFVWIPVKQPGSIKESADERFIDNACRAAG
jgi:two-component system, NtrC family, sensor kinase